MGTDIQNSAQLVGTSPGEMVLPGLVWRCCREPSGKQLLRELEDEGDRAEANNLLWWGEGQMTGAICTQTGQSPNNCISCPTKGQVDRILGSVMCSHLAMPICPGREKWGSLAVQAIHHKGTAVPAWALFRIQGCRVENRRKWWPS